MSAQRTEARGHKAEAGSPLQLRKRSYGTIFRANLPIEVFRTERPIRSWLRRFRAGGRQ